VGVQLNFPTNPRKAEKQKATTRTSIVPLGPGTWGEKGPLMCLSGIQWAWEGSPVNFPGKHGFGHNQRLKLTGAAILVWRGRMFFEAAPAT